MHVKNKTLIVFGVITYILSVLAYAEDLEGNYVAPSVLILLSALATIIFTIMATIRLWKTKKVVSILLLITATITLIYTIPIIRGLNTIIFIWTLLILWKISKQEQIKSGQKLQSIPSEENNNKLYRATLEKPIVFPKSIIITPENLNSIDFDKVIYCEVSPMGAMGNEGGILIYVLSDEDNLITYETNASIDQKSYDAVSEKIKQNIDLFINHSGGFGSYVYIKKNAQLEIDEKYGCFWYHSQNTKLRINSSVQGVFRYVVNEMKDRNINNKQK